MYPLLKPILFRMEAETAHALSLKALKALHQLHLLAKPKLIQNKNLLGLNFQNSVGLAAGLDKNGDYIDALASLGFGFIEIGTVTPKAQDGNPKPRLFRLPEARALINRMGFNNKGIDYLIENVQAAKYRGVLGINIGKNATTPIEQACDDYLVCLKKAYPFASYITINISSPNTTGLRNLQHGEFLEVLLKTLKTEQMALQQTHQKAVPLLVKVAPDLTETEIIELSDNFLRFHIDGVIATNTTLARNAVENLAHGNEKGGLSGAPLTQKSTEVLRLFKRELKNEIPLIAAGGIMNALDAKAKIEAGADLIQLYSGLIYKGPRLIKDCIQIFS